MLDSINCPRRELCYFFCFSITEQYFDQIQICLQRQLVLISNCKEDQLEAYCVSVSTDFASSRRINGEAKIVINSNPYSLQKEMGSRKMASIAA